jgi:hypothetical protein
MEDKSATTEHAKNPRNRYQTCQSLEIVNGGGGGRVSTYQCEAAGDGEGAGDDISRVPLGSDGVGISGFTSRRSVGRSAAGWRGRRE